MNYNKYFLFDVNSVIGYIKEKKFFNENAVLQGEEIGDGNINYVFRIWDKNSEKKIIVKQADNLLRSSKRKIDKTHNFIEANMLDYYNKVAPDFAPKLYYYDSIMNAIVMEDLIDYQNLRIALLNREKIPHLAQNISAFIVNTTIMTTDLFIDSFIKKDNVAKFINKEMCKITEDLVFTEPFINYRNRNIIIKENSTFVQKELYENKSLILEVAKLKNNFMNNPQALIHGDLHTGSIFVKKDKIKIIDPEFAFFGPIGYDLGCILGNFFFALVNAFVDNPNNEEFIYWIKQNIINTIEEFKIKFVQKFKEVVKDVSFKNEKYMVWYLNTILKDTAGCCGCEMIRRVVGDSKVDDITSIKNLSKRIIAERILIKCGVNFIMERYKILFGKQFIDIFNEIIKDFSEY